MKALSVTSLSIGYILRKKRIEIANNLNASLRQGEITCLLGPNGVGKSTLIRTLTGFQPALDGEILLLEKNLNDFTPSALSKAVSVVLTDKIDLSGMNVFEMVCLGRTPYSGFFGRLAKCDIEIVEEAIDMVGISHLSHRRISTLSDGERQKAVIAKSIAQQTPIIILDEPTAFLDYPGKVEMFMLLRRLAKEKNRAIFVSTHDLEIALQLADTLWLMNSTDGLTTGPTGKLSEQGVISRYFESDSLHYDAANAHFITHCD